MGLAWDIKLPGLKQSMKARTVISAEVDKAIVPVSPDFGH
jgi:hypothetical protein